ncbi:MAG: ATP-binding cassette domain-containing protein [Desulfomonile tiedjei]|uniref:ATP-binding cassette domain-containing protein n=1 Tax=Desulfomonile tiedjei TaxID=2358 RepID=A0A9D6UZ29_9BACT|nr:ATP-binding cassette domain-containing protein [Desulfomonile tiedjei]
MTSDSGDCLLSVRGLTLPPSARSGSAPILFQLGPSGTVWITGSSGIGKTTILRTLARLNESSGVEVFLDGVSWARIPSMQWRKRVVYLHQKPVLFRGTVLENLEKAFSFRCRSSERLDLKSVQALLSRLLLDSDVLSEDARLLSVGEGARVALVRSLAVNPQILLLDEITAALDPRTRDEVVSLLKEWLLSGRRGIVGVSHDDYVKQVLTGREIFLG